jgi:hypothetical protein
LYGVSFSSGGVHVRTTKEDGVFAQLRAADVDGHYVDRFEQDHQEIDRLLADCSGSGGRRHADLLSRLLGEHLAREESDLFPAAHQLLRPDQWDAVDTADRATQPSGGSR